MRVDEANEIRVDVVLVLAPAIVPYAVSALRGVDAVSIVYLGRNEDDGTNFAICDETVRVRVRVNGVCGRVRFGLWVMRVPTYDLEMMD